MFEEQAVYELIALGLTIAISFAGGYWVKAYLVLKKIVEAGADGVITGKELKEIREAIFGGVPEE